MRQKILGARLQSFRVGAIGLRGRQHTIPIIKIKMSLIGLTLNFYPARADTECNKRSHNEVDVH